MAAIPRTVIISRGGFSELCTGWNKVKTSERRMYRLFFNQYIDMQIFAA